MLLSQPPDPKKELESKLRNFWLDHGEASVIAGKHAEFVVEPKIYFGDKLNPEVAKLIIQIYLLQCSKEDTAAGRILASPNKIVIKDSKGKPAVIVRDKALIAEYLACRQTGLAKQG